MRQIILVTVIVLAAALIVWTVIQSTTSPAAQAIGTSIRVPVAASVKEPAKVEQDFRTFVASKATVQRTGADAFFGGSKSTGTPSSSASSNTPSLRQFIPSATQGSVESFFAASQAQSTPPTPNPSFAGAFPFTSTGSPSDFFPQ